MARQLKAEERIGMEFTSKEGCLFFVKEYINNGDVTIKFIDEYGAEVHTRWDNCKKGKVKNPYFKSVFGIGCLGVGDFITNVNGKHTREYGLWYGMMRRCYSGEEHYKTYRNVSVCDRWLCFANFLEDLPLIEGYELWLNNEEKMSLDKDIKQVGIENKVYSLETVKFINAIENAKEATERRWSK